MKRYFLLCLGIMIGLSNVYCQYDKPISNFPTTGGYRAFGVYDSQLRAYHNGADFQASVGTNVYALRDGYVIYSKEASSFGSIDPSSNGGVIIIKHQDNNGNYFYAVYGHLNRNLATNETGRPGAFVSRGQLIGTIRTFKYGTSLCPHLHLSIYTGTSFPTTGWGYSASLANWVDPVNYLNTNCSCSIPTNLSVTTILPTSAQINWKNITGISNYEVDYKRSSVSSWDIINKSGQTSSQNSSIQLNNLYPGTTYNYKVKSVTTNNTICSASSNYSSVNSFTTQCPVITNVVISDRKTNSAKITWTWIANTNGYILEYKQKSSSTWTRLNLPATAYNYTFSNLTRYTDYDYQIRINCYNLTGFVISGTFKTTLYKETFDENTTNLSQEMNLTLSPNPTTNNVLIGLDNASINEVKIFDLLGNLIKSINNLNIQSLNIETGDFAKGSYMIIVRTNMENYIKKMLIVE